MTKPTDHVSGGEDSQPTEPPKFRKVAILDPGFRVPVERAAPPPRILGFKVPTNQNDRRNLKFLMFSFLLSAVIFAGLEYKQIYEAAREAKHSAMGAAREAKHSVFDFFK